MCWCFWRPWECLLFCDYACDPRYEWCGHSARLFGQVFTQLLTDLNRVTHAQHPKPGRPNGESV
jgi:hypothetical protein